MLRLFVPKFYHNRRNTNFLYNLKYIGENKEIDEKIFFDGPFLGKKLYEYQIDKNNKRPINIHPRNLDWSFPEKFYELIGFSTIHGFPFKFKNAGNSLII